MKNNRFLTLIIVFLILLSSSVNVLGAKSESDDEGYDAGYREGYLDGTIQGLKYSSDKDDKDDKDNDKTYDEVILNEREIYSEYRNILQDESKKFEENFYSGYKEGFKIGYESISGKSKSESEKKVSEPEDAGEKDGKTVGDVLGNIYGVKDYYENMSNGFKRNIPSDSVLTNDFSLNNDKSDYKKGFLNAFKKAFEESYNKSYREANIKATMGSTESAYEDGKVAGQAKGKISGNHDYFGETNNDWKKNKISNTQIIKEYYLVYQSKEYRDGFISGFLDGFTEGYNEAYNSLSQNYVVEKSVVEVIPKSGGVLNTGDGELSIEIEKGTFYNNISLSIETIADSNYYQDSRYIKASNLYNIEITNKSEVIDKNKKIKLSFDYFDDYRGGVYKKTENKMLYINSYIEEDKIIAEVHPSTLTSKNNIYCVQVDKKVPIFPDARGNWANKEINTFVRRNIIYGYSDGYFKPDLNVTRGEFLTLLSRVYNWNTNISVGSDRFTDYNQFGNKDKIISYAVNTGYINGYSDNTFRPNSPISYREVEIIMSRVLDDPSFKWYNTAANMMYEKQRKSNSYNSIDNNINRSEVVYMLYILNEWRY